MLQYACALYVCENCRSKQYICMVELCFAMTWDGNSACHDCQYGCNRMLVLKSKEISCDEVIPLLYLSFYVFCRRARDQYTLAPGSFVQQRVTSPAAATATALKSSISWDPAFNGTSTSSSQGLMSAAQQQQQPSPQQQPGLERPCISKAGAPSAFESKQHGGNSAFAALTAIDCITEETSSIATESVRGSLPPSRENTAHGGGHYYRDSPVSANSHKDQDSSSGSHKGLAKAARGLGLTLLLTRSLGSSNGGLDSHGSGEGLYGTNTPKAAAAIGNTGSIGSSQLMQQLSLEQALSGSPSSAACECSSSPYPCLGAEGPAALATVGSGPAKKVRFNMERPAGSTPSRDYGLLYTAPELLSGQRWVLLRY